MMNASNIASWARFATWLFLAIGCSPTPAAPWQSEVKQNKFTLSEETVRRLKIKGEFASSKSAEQRAGLCKNDFNHFVAEGSCAPQVDRFCDRYTAALRCKARDQRYLLEHVCCDALLLDFRSAFDPAGTTCNGLQLEKCVYELRSHAATRPQ